MSETGMRTMFLSNADTLPIDPPAQARVEVLVWLGVDIGMTIEPRPKGSSGAPDLLDHSQPLEKSRKGHLVLPFRV